MIRRLGPALLALLLAAGCGDTVAAGGGGPADPAPTAPTAPPAGRVSGLAGFQVVSVTAAAGVTWALGTAACPPADCTSVARSTDGGRSWTGVTAPPAYVPGPGLLTSGLAVPGDVRTVRFGTARDGYVFGGALWSTHDGGRSWREVALDGDEVLDLATTAEVTYALVAQCGNENGAVCHSPRLLAAPAGGDAFGDVAELPGGRVEHGRVSTAGGLAVVSVDSHVLVSTGDGWRRSEPCGPGLLEATAAATGGGAVAVCVEAALGSRYLSVVPSADGARWGPGHGPSPRLTEGVAAVAAGSAEVVLVAWTGTQDDGGLLATRDGGRTWTRVQPGRPGEWWVDVAATGPAELLALPGPITDRYFTSTDGGAHWRAVRVG